MKAANIIGMSLAAVAISMAGMSHASFIAAIDEFNVTKNGASFFSDSFSDGIAPPSAPNFSAGTPAGYSVFGSSGVETGGKYYMDSTQGGYALGGNGVPRLRNLTSLAPNDSINALKPTDTFVVTGLFDLVTPGASLDAYGINLSDTTGPDQGSPTAGRIVALSVAIGPAPIDHLVVNFSVQDYTAHTFASLVFVALNASLGDQIMLRLERASLDNNLVDASYQYWTGGAASSDFFAVGQTAIFQAQQWTRAEFITNDQNIPVPAPSTIWLLLLGTALISTRFGNHGGRQA